MKDIVRFTTVAALIAAAVSLSTAETSYDLPPQLALGAAAPEFRLMNTVDGKTVALADYKGKAKGLVVIFSCNHCPVAQAYEARMIALGKQYQDKGMQFVLVSSNDAVGYPADGPAEMKTRAMEKGYPFPYLYDETQDIGKAFGARVTPHVFLFDKEMTLRYRGAIDDDQYEPKTAYLKGAMDILLAGEVSKIEPAETVAKGCSIKWR